jgi:hypothetical protein
MSISILSSKINTFSWNGRNDKDGKEESEGGGCQFLVITRNQLERSGDHDAVVSADSSSCFRRLVFMVKARLILCRRSGQRCKRLDESNIFEMHVILDYSGSNPISGTLADIAQCEPNTDQKALV